MLKIPVNPIGFRPRIYGMTHHEAVVRMILLGIVMAGVAAAMFKMAHMD